MPSAVYSSGVLGVLSGPANRLEKLCPVSFGCSVVDATYRGYRQGRRLGPDGCSVAMMVVLLVVVFGLREEMDWEGQC